VVVAKLLVLHRLQQFSFHNLTKNRTWRVFIRVFLAVVICGNLIGFLGNVVSALYFVQAAAVADKSASAWAANDTAAAKMHEQEARRRTAEASSVASVQRFCEVVVLLIMITAFLLVGLSSSRIIASALRTLFAARQMLVPVSGAAGHSGRRMLAQASAQGKQLRRKVVGTVLFVFFTVLVRSVFTVMYALAQAFQNSSSSCAPSQCHPCKNVYTHINFWILYTPVFQQVLMLVASPLALLVALWGMSGLRAVEQMSTQLDLESARHRQTQQRSSLQLLQ
jgi:hypothetical protein